MPLVFGYARVSTDGQTLDAQVAQLEAAGAGGSAGRVFREKVSGAAREPPAARPALGLPLPRRRGAGDAARPSGAGARATSSTCSPPSPRRARPSAPSPIPWADTTTAHGRLMLTVLAGPGGVRARADPREDRRGPRHGRRLRWREDGPAPQAHARTNGSEARQRREAGETLVSIARSYNVHHATIGRL